MFDKQASFTLMISDFINKANLIDYKLTFGEAYRSPQLASQYASEGKGISNSLHCKRLAVDFNAFFEGEYLDGSKPEHIPHLTKLGELWESIGGSWGGRFQRKDYNHYSLEDNGVR